MAINFPSSPAVNDTLAVGADTWLWNGISWEVQPIVSPSFNNITASGTITGTLVGNVTGNTAGTHTGAVVGNATTATTLRTARLINGVSFNGSANITIPATASAEALTGSTINSTVTSSSLTSVGTLNSLTVTNNITANANVVVAQAPSATTHATNKQYVDARSAAMAVALS